MEGVVLFGKTVWPPFAALVTTMTTDWGCSDMMFENNRDGILDEYTQKLAAECHIDTKTPNGKIHLHFIRGLVSDIVDRVAEDPERFKYVGPNDA